MESTWLTIDDSDTDDGSYDNTQSPSRSRFHSRAGTHTPPPKLNTELGRFSREQSPLNTTRPGSPSRFDSKCSDTPASPMVNPTSALLQGLIKEQRASRGSSRRAVSEVADDIATATPPSTQSQEDSQSEKQRKVNSALSAGLRQPREMGFREMDQYVSKINKLNFDLKLEVFHRTQQVAALEKKLERMQELEEELERMHGLEDELQELRGVEEHNQRLRDSNEQLRLELDKRDHAVTEAVELICQLEARIEEMDGGRHDSRPPTARLSRDDDYKDQEPATPQVSTPKAQMMVDIPERSSSKRGTRVRQLQKDSFESIYPRRAPSFLRDESKSASALRSLYSGKESKSHHAPSIMTRSESWQSSYQPTEPDSPRLSALSECSDLKPEDDSAIKKDGFDELDLAPQPSPEDVESKIARINRWIPPRPEIFQGPVSGVRNRAVSDVSWMRSGLDDQAGAKREPKSSDSNHLDVAVFGSGRLPPTPDTMSTSQAGIRKGSNGSVVAEKSRVDQAPLYLRRKLQRPSSAGDMALRPSTAATGVSDSMGSTFSELSQRGLTVRTQDDYPTMLPFFGQGTSKVHRLLGPHSPTNPRLSGYGGDLMLNGEGIEEAMRESDDYTPSLQSAASELTSTQYGPPSSPPLTPDDWMEAAKHGPRSRKEGSRRSTEEETEVMEPTLDPDFLPPTPEHRAGFMTSKRATEEPQLPRNSLRLRGWGSSPINSETQTRRRISLRPPFFNRLRSNSKSLQQSPMSDPVEQDDMDDGAPSPIVPKTRTPSAAKRSQTVQDKAGDPTARVEEASRELTNKILARPFTEADRPSTSNGGEYNNKRRSSIGLFGWMKGKDSQPSSPVTPGRSSRATRDRSSSVLSSRPPSVLTTSAMEPASMAYNETVSPAKAKRFSSGEIELPGRARYVERRARKMADQIDRS
ncbi:DNA replication complex GINS protein PSF3 [Paecilomyces lecythidis]|uniref:DNA replication complex GINS protein PSF3 n=1 Tax=Paecilomyces lecythidis TaxID=3004212 RepID=A0ABR3X737_9EURO